MGSHGSDVMKDHDADWVIAVAASFFDSGELGQFFFLLVTASAFVSGNRMS